MDDPLYIGYQDHAPDVHRRAVRRAIPVLGILVAVTLALVVRAQQYDPSSFEFGVTTAIEGRYAEIPVPHVTVDDGSVVSLVGRGKAGARIGAAPGSRIRVAGYRILREEQVMLEVAPGTEEVLEQAGPLPVPVRRGPIRTVGEIVGSKCFLGVMNPAHGTVHRSCARHCILGGVPAMLQPAPLNGETRPPVFLTGLEVEQAVRLAAQPVEVRGTMFHLPGLSWIEVSELVPIPGT